MHVVFCVYLQWFILRWQCSWADIKIQLTSANLLWCKGESHFILAPQVSPLLFLLYFHFQPPRDHLHQEAHRTDMLFTLSKGLNTQYSLIQSGLPARQVDKSTAPRPGQTRTEPGTSIVRNTSKWISLPDTSLSLCTTFVCEGVIGLLSFQIVRLNRLTKRKRAPPRGREFSSKLVAIRGSVQICQCSSLCQ